MHCSVLFGHAQQCTKGLVKDIKQPIGRDFVHQPPGRADKEGFWAFFDQHPLHGVAHGGVIIFPMVPAHQTGLDDIHRGGEKRADAASEGAAQCVLGGLSMLRRLFQMRECFSFGTFCA